MTLKVNPSTKAWMEIINANTAAMIFHHPAWMQVMIDCYGYKPFVVGVQSANDKLTAGVPIMEVNSFITGKRWVSLPFSDFCSPLYADSGAYRQLSKNILALAETEGIHTLELRGMYEDHPSFLKSSEFVFHEVALDSDSDVVFSRLHSMHKRNVKTARSKGVEIVQGNTREHLKEFYKLHLRSRRRQGVPVQPWKFFESLRKNLFENNLGYILLAYYNQKCVAGSVFLHWQKTLTYKFGASLPDDLKIRPSNLIMWTAIQWGCNNGFDKFDMGRTDLSQEGLRLFKSHWGAREYQLPYSYLASHKTKANTSKLKETLAMVIRKSPLWVCRLTGELLYGHFG